MRMYVCISVTQQWISFASRSSNTRKPPNDRCVGLEWISIDWIFGSNARNVCNAILSPFYDLFLSRMLPYCVFETQDSWMDIAWMRRDTLIPSLGRIEFLFLYSKRVYFKRFDDFTISMCHSYFLHYASGGKDIEISRHETSDSGLRFVCIVFIIRFLLHSGRV